MKKCYSIPNGRIVYEVLNAEVIVVDFITGNYYALIHVAKLVWLLLEQRISLNAMAQFLLEQKMCQGKELSSIEQDLALFCRDLEENYLIEPIDLASSSPIILSIPEDWEYDAPRLQKYTDVQSLLLLDPIHEVSDAGWPVKLG